MCGINGFNWPDYQLIQQMNQVTKNRGPDGEGVHVDHMVSLGHRRLAIIDLSEAGSQPMGNEDGTVWLVYNGEIYNFQELRQPLEKKGHVFKSATDSEVIIHSYEEYGIDCVRQFNGMWAFCIYDVKRQLLVLSRDRFGIKPLYYHVDGDRFIFCSMIAGILCHDIKTAPNDKAIMEYLAFNLGDQNEYTFFQNVNSLPGGAILEYDLISHKYDLRHWYRIEPQGSENAASIKAKFIESVRMHTVADVPIGSCLSGGVDSSAIVSVLSTIISNFNTYSLVVPGGRFDETRYIEEVGRKTGTKQFFTTVNEDAFLEEVHDFVSAQEEPVTGLSTYAQYRVMKLANQQGAKVLLDGQGADELFAGYIYYFAYYYYELLTTLRFFRLLKEMALYLRNFRKVYSLAMFGFLLLPERAKMPLWRIFARKWLNHRMLADTCGIHGDPRWQAMTLDDGLRMTLLSTAIPHLLKWEDKNSMRWSIESRVPFLDVNLVEAAYSLSSDQKLRNGRTKLVFREALGGIVPLMIMQRKDKIGFAAPGDELFRQPKVVAFAREILDSQSFRSRPYWRWPSVQKIFEHHVRGSINAGDTIWKLVNVELWLRQFFESSSN